MDINEILSIINLKQLDENKFEGKNYQTIWGRVFGGQVLGQSLHAAYQTVPEDRIAHSLHGYFILPGDINIPIIYEVDKIRNGGSFTTRLSSSLAYYASLDHALWFHRDFSINDWLLYDVESPSASNARGFSRGSIFNVDGTMIASVTQEGLVRKYISP